MRELGTAERQAIRDAARNVLARGGKTGVCPLSVALTIDRERIAVDMTAVAGGDWGGNDKVKVRLRDDRVARRFLAQLEAALTVPVPDGRTAILTLGAPIRMPNQTCAALTKILASRLASGVTDVDEQQDILGNRARFRILRDDPTWLRRVTGFVLTGDCGPGELAAALRAVHDAIRVKSQAGWPDESEGCRWLVLAGDWIADIKTYRRAMSLMAVPDRFQTVLMLFGEGRVETLLDRRT